MNNEDLVKHLNYTVCRTFFVFETYGISTREVSSKNIFCVIDLDELRIVTSFQTKRSCMDYITKVTLRVTTHRKLNEEKLH